MTESIELIQVLLGDRPYVLIEADLDPADSELILKVRVGGGAQQQPGYLPFMFVSELPPESNPVTEGIQILLDQHPESDRTTLHRLTDILCVPMPE
jgi:hypothetical protein